MKKDLILAKTIKGEEAERRISLLELLKELKERFTNEKVPEKELTEGFGLNLKEIRNGLSYFYTPHTHVGFGREVSLLIKDPNIITYENLLAVSEDDVITIMANVMVAKESPIVKNMIEKEFDLKEDFEGVIKLTQENLLNLMGKTLFLLDTLGIKAEVKGTHEIKIIQDNYKILEDFETKTKNLFTNPKKAKELLPRNLEEVKVETEIQNDGGPLSTITMLYELTDLITFVTAMKQKDKDEFNLWYGNLEDYHNQLGLTKRNVKNNVPHDKMH